MGRAGRVMRIGHAFFLLAPPVRLGHGGPFNVLIQYGLNFVYTKKKIRSALDSFNYKPFGSPVVVAASTRSSSFQGTLLLATW